MMLRSMNHGPFYTRDDFQKTTGQSCKFYVPVLILAKFLMCRTREWAKLVIRDLKGSLGMNFQCGIDKKTEQILCFTRKMVKKADLKERQVWSGRFVLDRWAVWPCLFGQFAFQVPFLYLFFKEIFIFAEGPKQSTLRQTYFNEKSEEGKCCG